MQRTYCLAIIVDQRRGSFPSSMLSVFLFSFIFSSVWPQYRKINAQSLIPRHFSSLVHPNQGRSFVHRGRTELYIESLRMEKKAEKREHKLIIKMKMHIFFFRVRLR